mgnify:CR=1 FL=1
MSSNVESILKINGLLITLIRRFFSWLCLYGTYENTVRFIILLINTRNTNYIILVL